MNYFVKNESVFILEYLFLKFEKQVFHSSKVLSKYLLPNLLFVVFDFKCD